MVISPHLIFSVSILETFVGPILLYGSENWMMTESLMKRLESFQGELAKEFSNGQSTNRIQLP